MASSSCDVATQAYTIGEVTFSLERPPDRGEEAGMLFDDDEICGSFDDTGWFYVWPAALALCNHLSEHAPLCVRIVVHHRGVDHHAECDLVVAQLGCLFRIFRLEVDGLSFFKQTTNISRHTLLNVSFHFCKRITN